MDKFLNFCFKFGKMFLTIFLVILFFATICVGFNSARLAFNLSKIKITYKFEPLTPQKEINNYGKKTDISGENLKEQYGEKIESALKANNISTKKTSRVLADLAYVDARDRENYVDNLQEFLKEGITYYSNDENVVKRWKLNLNEREQKQIDEEIAKYPKETKKMFEKFREQSKNEGLFMGYYDRYSKRHSQAETKKQELSAQLNIFLITLLSCILIFIFSLIVPLLIKIEENTRK